MPLKKKLGSEDVQDLIDAATKRANELPKHSVRDPWPRSQRVISETATGGRS